MIKFFKSAISAMALMLVFGVSTVFATANNHYVNGVEGVKGASVPPPCCLPAHGPF